MTAAGRNQEAMSAAYAGRPGVSTEYVDLTDDDSIAGLAERLGQVDHVVSTGSALARGRIADLDLDRNPVRRIGTTDDIAQAVMFTVTSTFLAGQTVHIDGGDGRWGT